MILSPFRVLRDKTHRTLSIINGRWDLWYLEIVHGGGTGEDKFHEWRKCCRFQKLFDSIPFSVM